jgi:hypothetical protein
MELLERTPQLVKEVPTFFKKMYAVKVPPGCLELMKRQGRNMDERYLMAYNALLWCLLILVPIASFAAFLAPYPFSLLSVSAVLVTIIVPALLLSAPIRRYQAEQRSFLLDSPAVVGAMTMSMNRSPSLERALELGSRSGDGALQSSLSSVVWKALTGEVQDLRRGISAWTADLDLRNEGLRRSLHLIMAAEEEPGKEGRDRLLDRANALVLEGMREASERYVGSLSFPVMLVFAFGVLAPVMLFSLIPLLGLGSGTPLDGNGLNIPSLAAVLLVIVPSATLCYVRTMIDRNPLNRIGRSSWRPKKTHLAMICAAVPLSIVIMFFTGAVVISVLFGLALVLFTLYSSGGKDIGNDEDRSRSYVDGLYRLGNAMLGGQDLEAAFEDSVLMEDGEYQRWGLRMVHATRTGRTSLIEAVRNDEELCAWNPVLQQNYLTVMECARDDHRGAGKVAVNLAQCQDDLARTKRRIRENLRSVMDMMGSTSLIFAPVIIGLTSGIMGMLGGEREWLMAVASVYVVELALLVNYFTSNLDGWKTARKGWRAYGVRGGIALVAFLTASLCGQTFLFRLL